MYNVFANASKQQVAAQLLVVVSKATCLFETVGAFTLSVLSEEESEIIGMESGENSDRQSCVSSH